MEHVSANLRIEDNRDDVQRAPGQRIGRGDGAKGIGEEEQCGSEQRRPQHRQRDVAPILPCARAETGRAHGSIGDRKSTRLNSSHSQISYAVFCLKKKINVQKAMLTYLVT